MPSNFIQGFSAWITGASNTQSYLNATTPQQWGVDSMTVKVGQNLSDILAINTEEELQEFLHVSDRMKVQGQFMKDLESGVKTMNKGLNDYNDAALGITKSVAEQRVKAVTSQAAIKVSTAQAGRKIAREMGTIHEHNRLGHPGQTHQVASGVQTVFAEFYS